MLSEVFLLFLLVSGLKRWITFAFELKILVKVRVPSYFMTIWPYGFLMLLGQF